jgi:hypothetical protein
MISNKCNVESVPYDNIDELTPTQICQAHNFIRWSQWFKFIMCKKIKCTIKFVRALLTSFLIANITIQDANDRGNEISNLMNTIIQT